VEPMEHGRGLQAARGPPLSPHHPRSLPVHVLATLTRSSGFGRVFNQRSALTGLLPALGADWESPAGHRSSPAELRRQPTRFAPVAGRQAALPADKSLLGVLLGPGTAVSRSSPEMAARPQPPRARRAEPLPLPIPGWPPWATHFSTAVWFGASGVTAQLGAARKKFK